MTAQLRSLVCLCLLARVCWGRLDIYPHPHAISRSDKFFITLRSASHQKQSTFVYKVTSDNRAAELSYVVPHRSVSWTSFAFSGNPVTAEITTKKDFHACVVRPLNYSFKCHRTEANTAEVVITQNTRMMSVEFDYDYGTSGQSDIVDKLLIFADAPEHGIPKGANASNLLYYGQGIHDLNGQMTIEKHVTDVYLARGAYVYGAFKTANGHPGVKIHGRGILSGEKYPFHDPRVSWALILQDGGSNHMTEGVVLVDPTMYYLRALGHDNAVHNIKTVGAWAYNSDGVALGPNGTVQDTFIMANDDALKIYGDRLKASRCVIWQSFNGAVFQLGWWNKRILHHVRVTDIDVIHTDWCAFKGHKCYLSPNSAVFSLAQGTKYFDISDLEFRNVRIEGVCPRIFHFPIPSDATGTIDNVRLVNWSVEKPSPYTATLHNTVSGSAAIHLTNWQIVDLKINKHCVSSPGQADIQTNRSTTSISYSCRGSPIIG